MEKKQIIAFIVVVIVLIIVSIFWKGKEPLENIEPETEQGISDAVINDSTTGTTKTTAPASKTTTAPAKQTITKEGVYIVSYESDGFNPKSTVVTAGTSVRFVNNSDKAMRVRAKEVGHPYTGLTQSSSIGKGGVYSFTFTTKGLWEFYNSNNPNDTGSVVVY